MNYMKRKVNLVGPSTLTVSLPSKWVKKTSLKKGDEINLEEEGNRLIISSGINSSSKKIEIDITNMSTSSVWRMVRALYIIGYTQITVNFDNPYIINTASRRIFTDDPEKLETYRFLRNLADRLNTLEVMEHSTNKIVLKETSKISFDDFDLYLKRILKVLDTITKEVYDATVAYDKGKLKNLLYFDNDVNISVDTCLKLLNNYSFSHNVSLLIPLVIYLEVIGDIYIDIAKIGCYKKIKIEKDTVMIFKNVNSLYSEFASLYLFGGDVNSINVKIKQLRYELFDKMLKNNDPYLFLLRQITDNLEEATICLYGLKNKNPD